VLPTTMNGRLRTGADKGISMSLALAQHERYRNILICLSFFNGA
jgi:hypothetical protein